jgi:MoaA/NifB/PqqE/SkfB family radical SAM enzyme
MTSRSTLLVQPYGGAIIDARAKVCFLNETATDMALALVDGCDKSQAAERIAKTYEISEEQALTDIEEFLQFSEVGPLLSNGRSRDWNVLGSENATSIVEADICLTNRCNLECTYCYAEAGRNRNGDLTPGQWTDAIHALVRLGMRKATVAGGEPTLSKAFFPVLELLAETNVAIQLFTNGLLLKPAVIERLKEIPLNFVQISLDSVNPEYHNRYRGPSHALAMRGIEALIEEGIPVVIGANIFHDTLDEVSALAELADSLGADLRCNPIEARGRGSQIEAEDTVANESLSNAIAKAVQEVSERRPHVFAEQEVRQAIEASERICPFSRGCIAVTASAEIRPCSQSDTFFQSVAPWAIDRKKAWEYAQTIEEHVAFKTVAQIQPEVCPTRENCAGCNKYPICAGCLLAGHTCRERR